MLKHMFLYPLIPVFSSNCKLNSVTKGHVNSVNSLLAIVHNKENATNNQIFMFAG